MLCTLFREVDMMSTRCRHEVDMMLTWCRHDVDMMSTWCWHDVAIMSPSLSHVDMMSTSSHHVQHQRFMSTSKLHVLTMSTSCWQFHLLLTSCCSVYAHNMPCIYIDIMSLYVHGWTWCSTWTWDSHVANIEHGNPDSIKSSTWSNMMSTWTFLMFLCSS